MNATKYYVSTTRLVVQGDPDTPSTWQDLYRMLPTLRNSLSCTVCESLLVEPYTPEETSCEHHVCKSCKGGVKALKPTCSWCKDYSKYSENVQLRILIQNYKKLCGLIKINRMWGHILRQGDQGQHIRDIISESEGERKGVRRCEDALNELKGSCNVDVKEEVVEEEIVGECELVPVDLDISRDDPPDEIISSPISKLSMYRNEPNSRELENVKVKLENTLDSEKVNSLGTNAELTDTADRTCRSTPSPTSSTPSPPNVQKYLNSTAIHNSGAIKTCNTAQAVKGGIRKIKGEAFILNPLKTKSDFTPFRKLDSTPKVCTVLSFSR